MTSPLLRPEGNGHPRRNPLPVAPPSPPRPPRKPLLGYLYPDNSLASAAALALLGLLGLGLRQFTFMWPGAAPVAEAYHYGGMALAGLWGAVGLLWQLARRRGTEALEIGLCLAGFFAWQMLLPGFMAGLTMNLPPAVPAEAYITATPTPLPTATPLPNILIGIAKIGSLNVRAGPGVQYPSIARLGKGDGLHIDGRDERAEWVHAVYPDGRAGWVAREFMDLQYYHTRKPAEPWGLPVLPAPTPAP